MKSYEDVLYEFSREAYEHELRRKAHFTTWLGLYLTILSVLFGLIFKGLDFQAKVSHDIWTVSMDLEIRISSLAFIYFSKEQ